MTGLRGGSAPAVLLVAALTLSGVRPVRAQAALAGPGAGFLG
jgi:hypothetical protein